MVENAFRKVILVALLVLGSVLLLLFGFQDTNLGLDLRGGTQLIYRVDLERAKAEKQIAPDADPATLMQETADIIYSRIDPTGVLDASVARRGPDGFIVELPGMSEAEALAVQQRIETLGRLEMRMLATSAYKQDGVSFDLDAEKRRLEEWLGKDGNRDRVRADPLAINLYNNQPGHENLHWFPALIRPKAHDASRWDRGSADQQGVPLFEPAELQQEPKSRDAFLVELLPINMHEVFFTGAQMDASGVYPGTDPNTGKPAVFYAFQQQFVTAYAEWSEKYIGQRSAIILNGIVESAPEFISRIPGNGIITMGHATIQEAAELAKVLKTGSLRVRPELQQKTAIGASLGEVAIFRGSMALALGAAAIVIFMLAYYRTAGVVAVVGLALNLLFLMAAMVAIRATLTLPGIAGLVLTLGMAIDGNILIYERIREELARGKAILQAVRAGFDRALLTILDANITTFAAGFVLYHIGVGPVRGFAVTMMIGIVTSVFTSYSISRLIYHYLLEKDKLANFRTTAWFANVAFNWVNKGRAALLASAAVIALLAVNVASTPADVSMGLEFTGGANLQIALREPMTKDDLHARLRADEAFHQDFPDPQIVYAGGDDEQGRSRNFAVKLKLRADYAERIRQERQKATELGETYEPPYLKQFAAILAGALVDQPYDGARVVPIPDSENIARGLINLHFLEPVRVQDLRNAIEKLYRVQRVSIVGDPTAEAGKSIALEVDIPADTRPTSLFGMLTRPLSALKNDKGERIQLSTPFPEASEIGSRMVGELQQAAIGAMILSWFLITMYVRVRFHEYKYGIAAIVALIHDVLVTFGVVVLANRLGLVNAEVDMAMIAALLTIVGYSINDTIVIFDRIRENLADQKKLGTRDTFPQVVNRAINQTFSRTVLTTGATMLTVIVMFLVTRGTGSALEGFSFALIVGMISGTYSTVFIAAPVLLWLKGREKESGGAGTAPVHTGASPTEVRPQPA